MKSLLQKNWKAGLSFLFGLTVFFFWGSYYPAHLSYQEQFQFFLFDTDYWWERIAVPGGLADYIAEYLIQFYYHPWAGACILALLYVALQLLVWLLAKIQGASDIYYPLSFLPVIALWHYMGDENAMLSFVIALLMALIAACVYTGRQGRWSCIFYVVITLPLLYWTAGPTHFVFMGWLIVREFINYAKQHNLFGSFSILFGVGVLGILCPLSAGVYVQYPLISLTGGINYYRYPAVIPAIEVAIVVLLIIIPFLIAALPQLKKRQVALGILQVLIITTSGCFFVISGCDMDKEDAMEYDQMARNKQWEGIILKAEKKSPTVSSAITCLNLALGKTGQLTNRMFEFYQDGTEGLLPTSHRDFTSLLPSSEVYYHLGMINTAQRFTFEAMEAIPNFRKSARCFKRLAETSLINGQYEVAAKYLRALQKTIFYEEWAEETMTYLYDEAKINAHKEWGWLRQLRYTEDFLFNERKMDVMLELLYQQNNQNRMAVEYMQAYALLQRD